jgi:hypothetical protein
LFFSQVRWREYTAFLVAGGAAGSGFILNAQIFNGQTIALNIWRPGFHPADAGGDSRVVLRRVVPQIPVEFS